MIIPSRRYILTSLASLIAAPAIVRAASIMPVKSLPTDIMEATWLGWNTDCYHTVFDAGHQHTLIGGAPVFMINVGDVPEDAEALKHG